MAQRISMAEYNKQSKDYTKEALDNLNDKIKDFFSNKKRQSEEEEVSGSDTESEEVEAICIKPKKKTTSKKIKFDGESVKQYERKIRKLEEDLEKEESKSHYLILDLSNAKCEAEKLKEKLKQVEENHANLFTPKFLLVAYLVLINIFFCGIWYSLPTLYEKLLFSPFVSFNFLGYFYFVPIFYPSNRLYKQS